MMTMIKPVTSLTTLALFVLALSCEATTASDGDRYAASEEIRTCISEVNRNADYADASRVVHWVVEQDQRNLAELEIRIQTSVYEDEDRDAAREYEASCVTGTLGKLVSFRINRTGSPD